MAMTEREFYNAVIKAEGVSAEIKEYAENGIAKLDAKNLKRKNTPTKEQIANEGLKADIVAMLEGKSMVASDIAKALNVSTQKASALCQLLVKEGKLSVADIKVKNKGAVKSYSLVEGE